MTIKTPLLTVENLDVQFRLDRETVHAVRGVSFTLNKAKRWRWLADPAPANP